MLQERRAICYMQNIPTVDGGTNIDRHEIIFNFEKEINNAILSSNERGHPCRTFHIPDSEEKEDGDIAQKLQLARHSDSLLKQKCQMKYCTSNGKVNPLACVPNAPNQKNCRPCTFAKKEAIRKELLDCLGLGRDCKKIDVRYCKCHPTEIKTVPYRYTDEIGAVINKSVKVIVPKPIGRYSSLQPSKSPSKGIGFDRLIYRQLKIAAEHDNVAYAYQQMTEANDLNLHGRLVNSNISRILKLDVLESAEKRMIERGTKRKLICKRGDSNTTLSSKKQKSDNHDRSPVYSIQDLVPKEVKRLTAFEDVVSMLCFILTVCGADIDVMIATNSVGTWLEEWLLYFVWAYGRVHIRLEDISKTFDIRLKSVRTIVLNKLKLVLSCRERWPKYASLDEDEALRKEHWNDMLRRSGNLRKRIIMHDMSDIPLDDPEEAEFNRALFNLYYGGSCGKGGIFTQLCGWQGTYDIFTGSVGDSNYVRLSGILEAQQSFQEHDKSPDGSIVPFINIFDKGYRVALECRDHGKQLCWQPAFARTDERYGSYATLLTAAVAYTRSGNERSVKHLKHSWRIAKGCKGMARTDLSMISDLWLAWQFETNFIYGRVH